MRQRAISFIAKNRYILLLAVLIIVLSLGGALLWKYLLDPERAFHTDGDWQRCFDKNVVNLALLGFDRNASRDKYYRLYRPDTIMLASLDLREGAVSLVSIPRDSYVKIHDTGGYDKINHAYMYGHDRPGSAPPHQSGLTAVLKTIEDFLGGVPVHYYISLDMDGVAEIIDHLGGFYYEVDIEVRAKMGRGRLLLDKGYQRLDGKKFLQYVRNRGVGGDLGRTQRQQRIMIAAFRQLRRQGRLKELPGIYRSLTENVETNLSFRQLSALALYGARVKPEAIKTYVFSGEMQYAPRGNIDALNYWVIDEQARVKLIKELFGVDVPLLPQVTLPGPRRPERPAAEVEEVPPAPGPVPSTEGPLPSDHRQGLSEQRSGGG